METKKLTRGLRNNNPLNIRKSSDVFLGEIESDDAAFKKFKSMVYGYRAAFVILGNYNNRGFNTIEKIIKRWAPPSDGNNTENYIQNVSKCSGVDRDTILMRYHGSYYIKIVAAMCYSENGIEADIDSVVEGFKLQNRLLL